MDGGGTGCGQGAPTFTDQAVRRLTLLDSAEMLGDLAALTQGTA